MKSKRRIEITVETRRILVFRRRSRLQEGLCKRCGKQVAMISLEELAQPGLSRQPITGQAEAGRLHFTANTDDTTFICFNSLLE